MFPSPPIAWRADFIRADLRRGMLTDRPLVVVWLDPSASRPEPPLAFSLTPSDAAHLAQAIDEALAAL